MELLEFLTCLPMFQNLDETAARALLNAMQRQKLPAGAVLFAQGTPGEAVYVLTSGRLSVRIRPPGGLETLNELKPGECVGEMSLLTGQPRTATVTALEDSELLCLQKPAFERLAQEHPALLSGLAGQLLPRFQRDQIKLALGRLFEELDDSLLDNLLRRLAWRRLDSGETLFHQGDPGDEMFIVVQGRLRIVAEGTAGDQRILDEIGTGEYVGEFALLAERGTPEGRRTATVYATRLTDLVVITRSVFEDLLCQYPKVLLNLTRQIVRRDMHIGRPRPSPDTNTVITLLPVQAGQALGDFAEQLAAALTALGPAMFLDSARFEQEYGKTGASQTALDHPLSPLIDAWLDERERQHRYAIYTASPVLDDAGWLSPWAQRCVEDADIILLVGEAGSDPAPAAVEKVLPAVRCRSRLELALLHPPACRFPSGTTAWLAPRSSGAFPVQAHHHIRLGNQSDFQRLARRIAGCPMGLVLAGGGARGWAHLGALRALEQAGMEFDWVAGASMGAIVSAGCALGWSSEQLQELAARFSNPRKLLDYTLPYASVTSTRNITTLLKTLFAGVDIEDTWHPFFCVSADLTNSRERMHTRGPLWQAVRASMAFPGVFAPVLEEDCLLVDGGAANNLPIDRMRELCPNGTVIGVDLITASPLNGPYDFGPSLSGWQVLLSRISPFRKKVQAPNLLDIVAGLVSSITRYRINESWHKADLLIRVPVQAYGLLEFDRYAEIIKAGYLAAQEQLKGFRSRS